jgi:hypothetical protein
MMMTMKRLVLIAVLCACHHNDNSDTTEGGGFHQVADTGDPTDRSGNMISPDKMDEVKTELNRKNMIVSHCLATAMEAKEVPRGAHGKIALEIVITGGKATSVKVIRSDIEAKTVQDCVIKHVQGIAFPQMNQTYETSHTYAMEAN